MHWMMTEILEQPLAVNRAFRENSDDAVGLCREIKRRKIKFAFFAARGSSDNAATFGKYLFGYMNGIPAGLAAPSLFTLYKKPMNLAGSLALGISQSGESPDVVEVLRQARKTGAFCAAITNTPGSNITRHAHCSLLCYAGEEKSVPATKTYTAEVALLCLVSFHLAGDKKALEAFPRVSELMEEIIALNDYISARTVRYKSSVNFLVLGRGLNYATALETALKIKETSHIKAEALSGADFLHGPVAVVEKGLPVIIIAPPDPTYPGMLKIAQNLKNKGAELIIVSSEKKILDYADLPLQMPRMDELFTPVTYIVAGQLLAYNLCLSRGLNPDKPINLRKITRTF